MKKVFVLCLLALSSLCGFAYNYDHVIINLDDVYINSGTDNYLVEHGVTIFNETYQIEVSQVTLTRDWFHACISIKGIWDTNDYTVEQTCPQEDPEVDPNTQEGSSISIDFYQNYDLRIESWMHLIPSSDLTESEIVYTIYDADRLNVFDVVLRFPYIQSITGIDDINTDNHAAEYYDLNGLKLTGPRSGIIIEKRGNQSIKKLVY